MKENKISRNTFLRHTFWGGAALAGGPLLSGFASQEKPVSHGLKIARFAIDATPSPGCYCIEPWKHEDRVDQPLSCRGLILLTDALPIVLVGVEWREISNGGYDLWRLKLAQAAGTLPDRVSVHVLHPHLAPKFDTDAENISLARGDFNTGWAVRFTHETIDRAAEAVKGAMEDPVRITHIGRGSAKVKKFASNRRILGKNGKLLYERFSSTPGHPKLRKYPAGLIDPNVRLVSFWNNNKAVAVLSYYATHPQSYYARGKSGISCDTVGIARNRREQETGIFHLHFDGAGGNIAAGKYNDGSHKMRQILAGRLAIGMKKAFEATEKIPITQNQVEWRVYPVLLPPEIRVAKVKNGKIAGTFMESEEVKFLKFIKRFQEKYPKAFGGGPRALAWMQRCNMGRQIDLSCLRLGKVALLHMPGELFVEYQLAAQKMREDLFVAMAAYGDDGPGYIGTRASYGRGGYETGPSSRVAPEVEDVLTNGMRKLLQAKNVDITPSYFTHQKKLYSK